MRRARQVGKELDLYSAWASHNHNRFELPSSAALGCIRYHTHVSSAESSSSDVPSVMHGLELVLYHWAASNRLGSISCSASSNLNALLCFD